MRKRVLITTSHPAPYMDKWFEAIEKEYDLEVLYNHVQNSAKTWKEFTGHKGIVLDETPIWNVFSYVKKVDITIWGGYNSPHLLLGIFLSWILKKKTIIFTDYPFHQNRFADFFKKVYLYRILDYIYCATESTQIYVENKYGSAAKGKSRFFPYAVDIPINIADKKSEGDRIKVLVANNFVERKGYATLFRALERLNDFDVRSFFHFIILGHGEEKDKYMRIAESLDMDIEFYGWIEPEKYQRFMDETDVYIHPSIEEPFGIPPIDAMGRKKVVIVSDGVKSTDKIIKNGVNGYIYSSRDVNGLLNILLSLDKEKFAAIGEKAHSDVTDYYSLEKNMVAIREAIVNS